MVMMSTISVERGVVGPCDDDAKTVGVANTTIETQVKNNKIADKHTLILRFLCITIIV